MVLVGDSTTIGEAVRGSTAVPQQGCFAVGVDDGDVHDRAQAATNRGKHPHRQRPEDVAFVGTGNAVVFGQPAQRKERRDVVHALDGRPVLQRDGIRSVLSADLAQRQVQAGVALDELVGHVHRLVGACAPVPDTALRSMNSSGTCTARAAATMSIWTRWVSASLKLLAMSTSSRSSRGTTRASPRRS